MLPYTTWWKSSYLFSYSRFDQIKGKQRSSTCILPKPASTSAHQGNILGSTSIFESHFSCSSPWKNNKYILASFSIRIFPQVVFLNFHQLKKEKKLLKIRGWRQRIFKMFEIQWKVRWIFKTDFFFNIFLRF